MDGALLSVRINVSVGMFAPQVELQIAQALADRLCRAGVDIIDLSAGFYTLDRQLIYPNRGDGSPPYYPAARAIALKTTALVSFAGNVTDLRRIPADAPPNLLVAVGRALIADPDFATKSLSNKFDEIRACARTSHCHYFSRGIAQIECGVNSNLGKEHSRDA
jgi:2,4-dienoyl-CoA reductase-like NADH-dependent reductase (Old Yellow Enzyme family)